MYKLFLLVSLMVVLAFQPMTVLVAADYRIRNDFQEVSLGVLPKNVREIVAIKELNLSNPYITAALTIAALNRYEKNPHEALEMLNMLKGPEPLSKRDKNFIRERLAYNKHYVARSYFLGATSENNYTPVAPPYRIKIKLQNNSKDNTIIKAFIFSSGAASPRPVTLRFKPSSGQWFLYEFYSLLSNIKPPKANDLWR